LFMDSSSEEEEFDKGEEDSDDDSDFDFVDNFEAKSAEEDHAEVTDQPSFVPKEMPKTRDLGIKLRKRWDVGYFEGEIVDLEHNKYRVAYTDLEEEIMSEEELG